MSRGYSRECIINKENKVSNGLSSGQAAAIGGTFLLISLLIGLVVAVFSIFCWWKIFSKAGYSGALSLLLIIPIANLVVFLILAFGEWPILAELNARRQQASYPPAQPGGGYAPNPSYPQYPQGPQYPR
jgi:hypothetical protein